MYLSLENYLDNFSNLFLSKWEEKEAKNQTKAKNQKSKRKSSKGKKRDLFSEKKKNVDKRMSLK